jgi:hypothetical protein
LNLKFYAANVLPESVGIGKSIRTGDESALDAILFS